MVRVGYGDERLQSCSSEAEGESGGGGEVCGAVERESGFGHVLEGDAGIICGCNEIGVGFRRKVYGHLFYG